MCLAVPGRIVSVTKDQADPAGGATGTVDFQGSRVDVSLAMTPEAEIGTWVLVHAGFALTVLDEAEAQETWDYLRQAGLDEIMAELNNPEFPPVGPANL